MSETNTAAVDSKDTNATKSESDTADKPDTKKFQLRDFKHSGVPALYTPRRTPNKRYIPYTVFGFPVTTEDKDDFAARFDFDPCMSYVEKREVAMRKLIKDIPEEYKHYSPPVTLIEYYKPAMCIVFGTNETEEDIYRALDLDMIEDVHNILQTYNPPGWFIPCGHY